ncbi:peptide chain release factor N(5)-glutamine methyltransferase [Ancylomarina euxinus]|uniref:Release factor glutamine methyltransferase n=1 Tax=Ancylomarina euxinus TaxID=2283627 RepID=A0A425Y882_9BACT|nr:peptide chain release factor N(5)-glutamine methyltransferase [Ancylomarina euxinus]MCZ4693435.1 peptide chain release factor N(5)-glutamine methyltransferase [Ancylomarina euxinus]MUP13662.1 peptide chain release factor N(5)-glutamine methyltransferase [Ancylomarina euxinus]RRG24696.1 peptide chain release factor N(5)-glutamine methyltransferase [Ancylomarina euxinus]
MNSDHTIKSIQDLFKEELKAVFPQREIESVTYILLEHLLNYSKIEIHLNKNEKIEQNILDEICKALGALKKSVPIQYVIGETEFYDLTFKVNEHTLIPRQETEELVHAIINENRIISPKILDIGTGSGCIPIVLAHNITGANISSVDVSEGAIATAKANAQLNQVKVDFYHRDFLKWEEFSWDKDFDIIVSNPPYVKESEKELMADNVLSYEPHTALFVDDNDPLIFYRRIAEFAKNHLKKGGKLYFEINEALGQEMIELQESLGFSSVRLMKDLNGRDRMTSAEL